MAIRCTRGWYAGWRTSITCTGPSRPLYELDFDPAGFQWVAPNDADQSVISFLRQRASRRTPGCCSSLNFTPVCREELPRRRAGEGLLAGDPEAATRASTAAAGQGNFGGNGDGALARYHGRPVSIQRDGAALGMVSSRQPGLRLKRIR